MWDFGEKKKKRKTGTLYCIFLSTRAPSQRCCWYAVTRAGNLKRTFWTNKLRFSSLKDVAASFFYCRYCKSSVADGLFGTACRPVKLLLQRHVPTAVRYTCRCEKLGHTGDERLICFFFSPLRNKPQLSLDGFGLDTWRPNPLLRRQRRVSVGGCCSQ